MRDDLTAVNLHVCPAVAMDALESETGKPPSHAAPGSEKQSGGPKYDYDAFATYATDPDGELVRAVEGFVEGFHRRRASRASDHSGHDAGGGYGKIRGPAERGYPRGWRLMR
jgi:hypothetical protein